MKLSIRLSFFSKVVREIRVCVPSTPSCLIKDSGQNVEELPLSKNAQVKTGGLLTGTRAMPILERSILTIPLRTRVDWRIWRGTCDRNIGWSISSRSVRVKNCGMFPGTGSNRACFPFRAFFHRMIGRQTTKAEVLRFQELNPV